VVSWIARIQVQQRLGHKTLKPRPARLGPYAGACPPIAGHSTPHPVRSSPPIKPTPSANSAFAGLGRRFRSFACVAEQHWAVFMRAVIIVHHAPFRACRSLALGLSAHDTEAMIARVWRGVLFESRAVRSIMSCSAVWSPCPVMSTSSLHGHNGAVRHQNDTAGSRVSRITRGSHNHTISLPMRSSK
jgi:hypothetical protein